MNPITQFLFATEVQGLAKLKLGNKDEPQRIEKKRQVLTGRDVSSFAIGNLHDRPIGAHRARCNCCVFLFLLPAQKEWFFPTRMQGALLKHCGKVTLEREDVNPDQADATLVGG